MTPACAQIGTLVSRVGRNKLCRLFLLGAVTAALASCSGSRTATTDTSSQRVAHAVAQLDTLSADILERTGVPGLAVAVVHQGKTIYAKGFGQRRLDRSDPVTPETVFQLASLSKSVGATVVAHQVGKGVVAWDTPIVQHLPWFALNSAESTDAVTIGDLYAHRSGLPDHAGDDLEELGYARREILERLRFLESAPLRTEYAYTNFGLTAAAEAVAVASGQDWEDLSEETLYRPLGMNVTSSRHADFLGRSNRADPHVRVDGGFMPGPLREPDPQSPAGGVSSSVTDMAHWMNMVLQSGQYEGRQLISPQALRPALEQQVESRPASKDQAAGHYGYGFNVSTTAAGHAMYSHSGAFIMGAATSFYLLPASETGIIVLTNAAPVGAAEALCLAYIDLVEFGEITRDWPALLQDAFSGMLEPSGELAGKAFPPDPDPALPFHAYTGSFNNDYLGRAQVTESSGTLALTLGPSSETVPLRHWNGDVFVFEPKGEIAPAGSRSMVTFHTDAGGTAQSLTIELYEESGHATLTRH